MADGLYTKSGSGLDTELYPAPAAPRLRRDQVYQELRRRLMLGEFPLNSRLVEERLAALLGVSRTPVREALVRLMGDGQVHRIDGGYYVATPDSVGLRDLYDLRITLELRGLTRSLEFDGLTHNRSALEPLRDQWRAMWDERPDPTPDFVTVDEDFHLTLLRASGNMALTDVLESVNGRIRQVRMYDFLSEERIELTIAEHLRVIEAVLARRIDDATAELKSHIGESMREVERLVAQALTHMGKKRGPVT